MLLIQDPTDDRSTTLLESIRRALEDARGVTGAFAFASSQGVRLLSQSEEFKVLAASHPVDLIVGIDAVTNERAIASLVELAKQYGQMRIRAFLNPRPGTVFHPKFCWTESQNGGYLIVGSGNLTERGLLGNWEAYSSKHLTSDELNSVEATWKSWVTSNDAYLLPLDDPRVIGRAKLNNQFAMEGDWPTLNAAAAKAINQAESETTQRIASEAKVLVAEVPRSADRKSQVNFHKEDYYSFFGAEKGRPVVFRQVNADGTMLDYEQPRPPVVAQSRNFRFELHGMKERSYPDVGRPIGIYIRVAIRTFFYRIVFPLMPGHNEMDAILGTTSGNMRTAKMDAGELRNAWPTAPFWKLPTDVTVDIE